MNDPAEPAAHEPASTWIVAFTAEDPVLGGIPRLDLGERWTVLVGKNGAGKSRLLENLYTSALAATTLSAANRPARVKFEIDLAGIRLDYKYVCTRAPNLAPPDGRQYWLWNEVCIDPASKTELWQVGNGTARIGDAPPQPMPPMAGLLHLLDTTAMRLPPQAEPLRTLLHGVRLVRAGVPRHAASRERIRLQTPESTDAGPSGPRWTGRGDDRLIDVVMTLVSWFEGDRDRYDTVVAVGRRLQVLQRLDVRIEDIKPFLDRPPLGTQEAEVFVDGVNFGYLSDGTQRLIELVVRIVDPTVRVLLLEEPETSVHPGLLRRLLAELNALGPGRQVVISTHSTLVLDAAAAEDVRLVERSSGGVTSVRPLNANEHKRLRIYLDDDLDGPVSTEPPPLFDQRQPCPGTCPRPGRMRAALPGLRGAARGRGAPLRTVTIPTARLAT